MNPPRWWKSPTIFLGDERVFIYRSGAFDIPIGPIPVSLLPSLYTIRFAKKKNNINIHENAVLFFYSIEDYLIPHTSEALRNNITVLTRCAWKV